MKNVYLFFLLISFSTHSQLSWNGNSYSLESSLFVSSDTTLPFLMRSQTYGEVPVASQFLQLKGGMHHEYDSTYSLDKKLQKFGLGYGTSIVANVGKVNQFIISQGYLKARYGIFELWAGRRKETIGLVDSTLSSGSLIWGGNALPLPKIQFEIPNYVPIVGNGLVSIKGTYAHGWFGSTNFVKNYLLHQKTLYTRVGRPHWKFKFYAGFNHQVQWSGAPAVSFYDRLTDQVITRFPSGLGTYLNVVTGVSLNKEGDQVNGTNGVPFNEAFNRAGNHLGTLDIGFEYEFRGFKMFLYRQSIYEDGSLFYLNNIQDGLLGLSIKPSKNTRNGLEIINFNMEWLDSRSQGGSVGGAGFIPELRGVDNYFNNGIYVDGWTYRKRSMANAFFMPLSQYWNVISNAERFYANRILNSRLTGFMSAIDFSYRKVYVKLNYSRSINYGNYSLPFNQLTQNAVMMTLNTSLKEYNIRASIAGDWGAFLGNRIGFNLGVSRSLYQ